MAYREKWVLDILGKRSVLDVALDVHGTANGSIERNPTDQANDVRALEWISAHWERSRYEFDRLVLSLILVALDEHAEKDGRV